MATWRPGRESCRAMAVPLKPTWAPRVCVSAPCCWILNSPMTLDGLMGRSDQQGKVFPCLGKCFQWIWHQNLWDFGALRYLFSRTCQAKDFLPKTNSADIFVISLFFALWPLTVSRVAANAKSQDDIFLFGERQQSSSVGLLLQLF